MGDFEVVSKTQNQDGDFSLAQATGGQLIRLVCIKRDFRISNVFVYILTINILAIELFYVVINSRFKTIYYSLGNF